jgi:hypothetical protein
MSEVRPWHRRLAVGYPPKPTCTKSEGVSVDATTEIDWTRPVRSFTEEEFAG